MDPIASEFPDPTLLPPTTQRLAADIVASLWPDREDIERTNYVYWYREYILKHGDGAAVCDRVALEIETLRKKLLLNPAVKSVEFSL